METLSAQLVRILSVLLLTVGALVIPNATPAQAASWSYCNGDVCQILQYSGRTITQWKSQGYGGGSFTCHTARFWVNGGLIDTEYRCGTHWLTAYGPAPKTWASGTQICTSWSSISGMSCYTV